MRAGARHRRARGEPRQDGGRGAGARRAPPDALGPGDAGRARRGWLFRRRVRSQRRRGGGARYAGRHDVFRYVVELPPPSIGDGEEGRRDVWWEAVRQRVPGTAVFVRSRTVGALRKAWYRIAEHAGDCQQRVLLAREPGGPPPVPKAHQAALECAAHVYECGSAPLTLNQLHTSLATAGGANKIRSSTWVSIRYQAGHLATPMRRPRTNSFSPAPPEGPAN